MRTDTTNTGKTWKTKFQEELLISTPAQSKCFKTQDILNLFLYVRGLKMARYLSIEMETVMKILADKTIFRRG